MMKKTISILLVLSVCFSLSSVAFAAETKCESDFNKEALAHIYDDSYWETVYVTLDDGSVVALDVHVETSVTQGASTLAMTPEVPVGTIKAAAVRISNTSLGVVSMVGDVLSAAAKNRLASLAATAIASQVGYVIATAAVLLGYISTINAVIGNNGFVVTYKAKYTSTYNNSQDHYVYGWTPTYFKLSTY